MSELPRLLCDAVSKCSRDHDCSILLSGGIDSTTVAIAAQDAGKTLHAVTYELKGYRSKDRERAEVIARHLGIPLDVVTVPVAQISMDFKRLAIQFRCKTKVQFEVGYALLYVFRECKHREVLTGFNADDHFANSREPVLLQARLKRNGVTVEERKRVFDEYRAKSFEAVMNPDSSDSWPYARRAASYFGKELLDPYLDLAIRRFFHDFDHDQLSPMEKPVVRDAFAYRLSGLPPHTIAKGVRLQIGSGINELFETLLNDPDINRFEQKYTAVSPLCQRWAREVEADPAKYTAELDALPSQSRAHVRASRVEAYQPYMTADVLRESRANKFKVVSTFAGGAGSSTGYCLAGGNVVLANDFVPEAARTYRANFPDCIIDPRDIREISGSDEAVAAFLAAAGLKPGDVDMLDGSPPCKEFSTAGRGIGDQDVMRPYSDVEQNNIASLPFDLTDLVLRARPKVFVCENVPALASRGKEVLEGVLRALRFTGGRAYYADSMVLTASDFGVPQKRRRLFIIAVRKDVGDLVGINSDAAVRDVFPAPTKVGVSVRSALDGLVQRHEDIWPWVRSAMVPSLAKLLRILPKNPPRPTRLAHIIPDFTSHYTLTRCSWERPAPTMVVAGQQPDGLTGAIHPEHDRKFTLPELKRLTGLPDDFVLTGTLGQASERVCRMVPPFLTQAIAESIYENVLKPYKERFDERR